MIKKKREMVEFKVDEFPKNDTDEAKLAKLRGAFPLADGTPGNRVTAGNASGINDGAAAIVLASGEAVKKYGLKPMAKLVSCCLLYTSGSQSRKKAGSASQKRGNAGRAGRSCGL